MLQLSVTALFYLDNSKKIHLRGVRACQAKDAKRRAPQHAGEREREKERERESACTRGREEINKSGSCLMKNNDKSYGKNENYEI